MAAAFESRTQVCALLTGAFLICFFVHMFIVAEAKKKFGDIGATHPKEETSPMVVNGYNLWRRLKGKVSGGLSNMFKEKAGPSAGGQRKLFSFKDEDEMEPDPGSDSESQQGTKRRRLGKHQKLVADILEAFCTCDDNEEGVTAQPSKNETSEKKKPSPSDTTLELLKKAITDPILAKKIFDNYDICEIDGWIFITAAIILTCIFNYTLVFCCCLCFYKRRPKTYSTYPGNIVHFNTKDKKVDYLDADYVESEKFLPKINGKAGEVP